MVFRWYGIVAFLFIIAVLGVFVLVGISDNNEPTVIQEPEPSSKITVVEVPPKITVVKVPKEITIKEVKRIDGVIVSELELSREDLHAQIVRNDFNELLDLCENYDSSDDVSSYSTLLKSLTSNIDEQAIRPEWFDVNNLSEYHSSILNLELPEISERIKDCLENIVDSANTPESDPEPVNEPTPEPVNEPTPEPVNEPTPEPVNEPTPEPVNEPTPEPVNEPTPEPVNEPESEPVDTQEPEFEKPEITIRERDR